MTKSKGGDWDLPLGLEVAVFGLQEDAVTVLQDDVDVGSTLVIHL